MRNMICARAEDVVTREIAGETILIPIRGAVADMEKIFVLEGAGEYVWGKIDGQTTLAGIAGLLARDMQVDAQTALADVVEFAGQLKEQGLVREVSANELQYP